MRVRSAAAFVALLVVAVVAGCGGGDGDGSTSASTAGTTTAAQMEKATITVGWPIELKTGMEPVIDRFNDSQSVVTVKPTFLPFAQFSTTLATQLQSGGAPDVFYAPVANAGVQSIWPLASAGKLLDMSGESWAADMGPDIKEVESYQGKVYGLPTGLIVNAVLYNTDLFDEMGLTAPETFSDLLDVCKKISAKGKVPIAAGFADILSGVNFTNMGMVSNVYSQQPDWDEQRDQGKVTFAGSKEWRHVYDEIGEMKDAGCFDDAPQGIPGAQAMASFAKGDAVMLMSSGSSIAPAIKQLNPDISMNMLLIPPDDPADTRVPVAPTASMVASGDTDHPEQVKAFFDYASQPAQIKTFTEAAGLVSEDDLATGQVPGYMQGLQPLIKEKKYVVVPTPKWPSPKLVDASTKPIAGLFTGQTSVDDILKGLDTTWDEGSDTQ